MDYATLVGDALLALSTLGTAIYTRQKSKQTTKKLDVLAEREITARIYRTVIEVMATQEGDRLREALHAVIRDGSVDTND